MSKRLRELESEANYYQEKIQEVEKERTALFTDPHELEKFARETYLMKKRSEDVYVISKD